MPLSCVYNGRVYNIVYNFSYNSRNFTICSNEKKIVWFKHDVINNKDIYTPYDRWIKAFKLDSLLPENSKLDMVINRLDYKRCNNVKYISKCIYKGLFKPKYDIRRKILNKYFLVMLICICSLGLGVFTLFNWYNEGQEVKDIMGDILANTKIEEQVAFTASEIPEVSGDAFENQKYGEDYWKYMQMTMMSVDFNDLLKINPDTRGWLYVNNTNVNYPFVQSGDNNFYLTHSFDKSYNVAGWLFADYKSTFDKFGNNTVIYGHGRVDQVMFGSLQNVLNESWYTDKENQIIKLSTPEKNTLWQVFSIYTIPAESYYLTHTFENEESYLKFINTMKSRSIYNFGVDVGPDDKLLTISTCLDTNGNRIVIQAKLIKEQSR